MEAQILQRVNEVSAGLVRTPGKLGDLNSVLRHIALTAQTAFATDACVILAFNPITGNFIGSQVVVDGLQVNNELLHDRPRPNGVTQQVLKEGIVLVPDLEITPQYHNLFTRKEGFRSFAGLAVLSRHRQRPLGVIYLDFRQPKAFNAMDYENFKFFANQATLLLQETWLEIHLEEVARIGQEINHNLALVEDLFQELQKYVDNVLDDSHTLVLGIYQSQTNTLDVHIREQNKISFTNIPLQGTYKDVIETQTSRFIPELSAESEHNQVPVIGTSTSSKPKESLIVVPLTLRGEPMGILSIQHSLPKAYGQEDHFVLQLLANYIALALHNIRLYGSLTELNETGQILTQQLESEQTLDATVEKIRDATKADIVVLYPYEPDRQRFVLPPRRSGTLLDSPLQSLSPSQPDDIAVLMLRRGEPIYARESTILYNKLLGEGRTRQGHFAQRERIRSTAVVPLQVGDQSVGVLFVNFRQTQYFDAPQKKLIDGLAHYAAIAIKNAQEYGSLIQRRVRELEILQNIDLELSSTLDLGSVLNTLLKLANEQVHAEEASILLRNPHIMALEIPAALGPHAEARRTHIISLQETKGITRWVFEHKKPARVENVHRDPHWRGLYIEAAADTVSELDVPLLDGGKVVGVLNFESPRERAFRQEDEDFLLTLAGQAVLAIRNAQAYEREKRLVEEERVLNQISKEITSQLNLDYMFNLILERALELTHSTLGSLHLFDPDLDALRMVAERGVSEDKKGQRQKLGEGIVGYVAKHRQSQNVEDVTQLPWNEIYMEFFPGARSELAVPMLAGGELRGVLNVESPFPNNFTESDERLLQGLADLAVVALQNAQAYEREKRLAEEGQILNEISKEITSQFDHMRVFDLILKKTLELTRSTLGSLLLYDPQLNDLWIAAERGLGRDKRDMRIALYRGIVGYVATHKRFLNVDVSQPPWNKAYLELFSGTRSELAVPMLAGDELRGVLNVESTSPNQFSESDERLLKGLADLAVVALQNAESYKQAEMQAQRFKLLYQAGQELSKITDLEHLEQAYKVIVQIADQQSQSQAVIYRYDTENIEMVLKCTSPDRHAPLFDRIQLHEGITGQVARERRTIVVHDADNLPPGVAPVKQSDPSMHSLVVTPIMFEDRYYGNLGLRHRDVGHFRDADIEFYTGLAQLLASTIHRLETAQERQEFEQRAHAAEEMSLIGQSAFEVTHRLGNDLGLVNLYISDIHSELDKLGVANGLVSKKLNNISQAVQHVLSFSGDLKQELARLGAKEEMVGEPTSLLPKSLFEEAKEATHLPANVAICVHNEDDVTVIRGVHSLVTDILRNLIANAIQAMPGGGTITLRSHNAGRYVALDVSDTGVGIAPERLSQIFGLFFSTKGSSGFGLWSARRNALRNHGDLKVESKLGEGSTFTLLLPRADVGTV